MLSPRTLFCRTFFFMSQLSFLTGFTFDDIITLPGSIDFGVEEVSLDARITRNIPMVTPLAHTTTV